MCSLIGYSKPKKNTVIDQAFIIYNDSLRYSIYIDSVIKSYNFCISDTNNVFTIKPDSISQNASYEGGVVELLSFLRYNIVYPSISRENNITGKVFLKFVIDEEGKICNITVLKPGGVGLAEEAIRVISLTKNKWLPAKINNRKVKSYYTMPIGFKMS